MHALVLAPADRLLSVLDADGRIAIRRVLRKLRRDADALLAYVEVRREIFDSVGDDQFTPSPLVIMTARTVPVLEPKIRLKDDSTAEVVSLRLTLTKGWSNPILRVVAPGNAATEVLGELVERAGEDIEDVLLARM